MKTYNTYYTNKEELKTFVEKHRIEDSPSLLIQIFTSMTEIDAIRSLQHAVASLFEQAHIIGTTTDGEIGPDGVTTGETVVSFSHYEATRLQTLALPECGSDPAETGRELARRITDPDTRLLIAFVDGLSCNGERFLHGFTSIQDNVVVSGGLAGDNGAFQTTYVLTRDAIYDHGVVGVTLANPHLHIHTNFSFNWLPIGKAMLITHAEANRVYTIDNKPARSVYAHYLGEEVARALPASGLAFPLLVRRGEHTIARATLSVQSDQSITFAGNIKTGDTVFFGYGDAEMILDRSIDDQYGQQRFPVEGLFIYSCMARRRFMPDLIGEEIRPFQSMGPVAGFFTYGEFFSFADSGQTMLLNQTMTILALSESSEHQVAFRSDTSSIAHDAKWPVKALSHLLNVTVSEMTGNVMRLERDTRLLQVKQESLRLAQEIGRFGSFEVDIAHETVVWSDTFKTMCGWSPTHKGPSMETFLTMLLPGSRSAIRKALRTAIQGKIPTITIRLRRPDNAVIVLRTSGKILLGPNGKPSRIIGTAQDITQEIRLRKKNEELASILERSSNEIYIVDPHTLNFIYANNAALTKLGYSLEELRQLNTTDVVDNFPAERIETLQKQIFEKQESYLRLRHKRRNGETYPVQAHIQLLVLEEQKKVVVFATDITQQVQAEKEQRRQDILLQRQARQLTFQAMHDSLTGLPNRALLEERLQMAIREAQKRKGNVGLLFIDLDNFKQINDTLGHTFGDEVLKIVSKRFKQMLGTGDVLARQGGDEFVVVINKDLPKAYFGVFARKLIDALKPPIEHNGHEVHIHASIGISLYPRDADNANDLLQYADTAMYEAKDAGRNTYCYYTHEMTLMALHKAHIETRLRRSLKENEFVLHYQPKIDGRDRKLIGMEALVRWKDPDLGLVYPDQFIPVAEKSGLLAAIDLHVMDQAMATYRRWYDQGLKPGVLALNLSIRQLLDDKYIPQLRQSMARNHFRPEWLELEITENHTMSDPELLIRRLKTISNLGISIAIDDFGTGYSSLAHLKRMPVSVLKIDRSFIVDLPDNKDDRAIASSIISLGNSLNLKVIAEGVQNRDQVVWLMKRGCHQFQGYYFSRPMNAGLAENFLYDTKEVDMTI